jgi:small subunit ribosomal protein S12
MPTINQLLKNPRRTKVRTSSTPALQNCPQKKVSCVKVLIRSPKKPNSGERKIARVKTSIGQKLLVYIPGEKHSVAEHASLLIQGGKTKDLPGFKYKVIRGALDAKPTTDRKRSRSLFGVKKPKEHSNLNSSPRRQNLRARRKKKSED